ncbi:MAG TPA: hypothetical protein PKE38_09285 [Ignavibacteriaceae bacterium]|nr:hypothetical protein [Ignavibacteriaceae bacterium]
MTFYHKCLGGELTLTRLGDSPMSGDIEISATDWFRGDKKK